MVGGLERVGWTGIDLTSKALYSLSRWSGQSQTKAIAEGPPRSAEPVLDLSPGESCGTRKGEVTFDEQWRIPGPLILSVTTLDDFVLAWQNLLLQDFRPPALLYSCDFEDLSRVHVGIRAPTHDRNASDHTFIDLRKIVAL